MNFKKRIDILLNKKQKFQLILLLVGTIAISFVETIGIGSLGVYVIILSDIDGSIDKIPNNLFIKDYLSSLDNFQIILFISLLLCAIFFIKNLLIIFYHYCELLIKKNIIFSITTKTYLNYLKTNYSFYLENNSAKLINNIDSMSSRAANYIFFLILLIKESLLLIFLLVTIFFINLKISISIFFGMFIISLLIYLIVKTKLRKYGKKSLELEENSLKSLNQGLGGFKIIKILGTYKYFFEEFSLIKNYLLDLNISQRLISLIPRFALEVLSVIAMSLISILLFIDTNNIRLILPTITLFGLALIRMVPSFLSLSVGFQNLGYASSAFEEKSEEMTNIEYEIINETEKSVLPNRITKLSLNNISFNFKNSERLLKNVNIEMEQGDFIGVIGKTGSGKSTLIDIMLGLLKPISGNILCNGKSIYTNIFEFRKKIGYVPQEVYLSDDSLLNNIAYGLNKNEIDFDKVESSLKKSQLKEFVETLPNKIHTLAGDKGTRVSGGQKQRIGIARALYNDPSIIIMDESTNSLDEYTEDKVIQDVKKLSENKIIIFVTHKESALKFCNKIYEIKNGNCEPKGDFEKYKSN